MKKKTTELAPASMVKTPEYPARKWPTWAVAKGAATALGAACVLQLGCGAPQQGEQDTTNTTVDQETSASTDVQNEHTDTGDEISEEEIIPPPGEPAPPKFRRPPPKPEQRPFLRADLWPRDGDIRQR